jgi:hypothetical protein
MLVVHCLRTGTVQISVNVVNRISSCMIILWTVSCSFQVNAHKIKYTNKKSWTIFRFIMLSEKGACLNPQNSGWTRKHEWTQLVCVCFRCFLLWFGNLVIFFMEYSINSSKTKIEFNLILSNIFFSILVLNFLLHF